VNYFFPELHICLDDGYQAADEIPSICGTLVLGQFTIITVAIRLLYMFHHGV
jgi:hypothetical protein